MQIKALFIDIDDTIFDYAIASENALIKTCKELNIAYQEDYLKIYRQIDQSLWNLQKQNKLSVQEVGVQRAKLLSKAFGFKQDYQIFRMTFSKYLANEIAFIKDAQMLIEYAYNKGYLLYVASNGILKTQKSRLSKAKIDSYFQDFFVSDNITYEKPDPRFFYECLKRANLKVEEVLMIGDSVRADIKGAQSVGIKTCWFDYAKTNQQHGDYNIQNLKELIDILDKEGK